MSTIDHLLTLTVVQCAACHVPFGIPNEWERSLRQTHATFYCPAGHTQGYTGKTEAQKLADQLATEKRLRGFSEATLTAARDQLDATKRSLAAQKGAKTRIKNRIANGVCPCCNRQFQDLHRHMTGQHPDFTTEPKEQD